MKTTEARFAALRTRFAEAEAKREEFHYALCRKYGRGYQTHWLKTGEEKKRDALRARADAANDAFFAFLDTISPRNWRVGISFYWVLASLSYADATTRGELSTLPQASMGSSEADMKAFARALPEPAQLQTVGG